MLQIKTKSKQSTDGASSRQKSPKSSVTQLRSHQGRDMLQLPQKKSKLWEDLMISALSLDCRLLLDELTHEKIGTLENLCE